MRRTTSWMPGALLAVLGLTLGLSCAPEPQKVPQQSKVEVTYYYLPG